MSSRDCLEDTYNYWERLASDFANRDEYVISPLEPLDSKFCNLEKFPYNRLIMDEGVVLDVGCGYGRFSIPLAMLHQSVVAVDLSMSMLGRLRSNVQDRSVKKKLNIVRADARYLPFRPRCFKGIICIGTFYYFPTRHWRNTLESFSTLLFSDGWLILNLKSIRNALRLRYVFGLLYLAAYVVLRLESKISFLTILSKRFGLHGRTEYLVSMKRASQLLLTYFFKVYRKGTTLVLFVCRYPRTLLINQLSVAN